MPWFAGVIRWYSKDTLLTYCEKSFPGWTDHLRPSYCDCSVIRKPKDQIKRRRYKAISICLAGLAGACVLHRNLHSSIRDTQLSDSLGSQIAHIAFMNENSMPIWTESHRQLQSRLTSSASKQRNGSWTATVTNTSQHNFAMWNDKAKGLFQLASCLSPKEHHHHIHRLPKTQP